MRSIATLILVSVFAATGCASAPAYAEDAPLPPSPIGQPAQPQQPKTIEVDTQDLLAIIDYMNKSVIENAKMCMQSPQETKTWHCDASLILERFSKNQKEAQNKASKESKPK